MRVIRIGVIATLGMGVLVAPARAAEVMAFAQAVGGQSNVGVSGCTTYSSPIPSVNGFSFGSFGQGNPGPGNVTCGIAQSFPATQTATTGTVTNSAALGPVSFNSGLSSYTGSAASSAQSGKVGAAAHATFTGPSDGNTVKTAQGAGVFSESFTFSNAALTGQAGSVVFGMNIDGSLNVVGFGGKSSSIGLAALYRSSTVGTNQVMLNIQASNDASLPNFAANPTTGFTVANGSASGGNLYATQSIPFVWGTPFDFTFGMLAFVNPADGHNTSVDFLTTALLDEITVRNAAGEIVQEFGVSSASGTRYTADGLQEAPPPTGVPEPASIALLLAGIAGLAAARRGIV